MGYNTSGYLETYGLNYLESGALETITNYPEGFAEGVLSTPEDVPYDQDFTYSATEVTVGYEIGRMLGHYLARKNDLMLPDQIKEARALRNAAIAHHEARQLKTGGVK